MDRQFSDRLTDSLVWLPERGMGYYPVRPSDWPYDDGYFAKYQSYAASERGKAITAFRVDLVNQHTSGQVLDIGIGCGAFIEARGERTQGYDIMPAAVQWLTERGLFVNPFQCDAIDSISCWDSLEHLPEPHELLRRVTGHVFMSLPIFDGPGHVLRSKHYRQDEHYWYWTADGLRQWMAGYGFDLVESSTGETDLGREDIGTFVFKRQ